MPRPGPGEAPLELLRPSSLAELTLPPGSVLLAGGTEVVPLMREGLLAADALVDLGDVVPRGVRGLRIGAGTTLAELGEAPDMPDALREACRLAASPALRSMGSIGGNLLQQTRCWYWRLGYPCRLHGGDRCHARDGAQREHAIFANDYCASAHPSDLAACLIALGAQLTTNLRRLPLEELYRLPDDRDRSLTTLGHGEVLLELELAPVEASVYLKAMDRKRFAFPLVGVAAARSAGSTRVALAGVAPIPWLLEAPLDTATPLPGSAYKLEIARALLRRALASIEQR